MKLMLLCLREVRLFPSSLRSNFSTVSYVVRTAISSTPPRHAYIEEPDVSVSSIQSPGVMCFASDLLLAELDCRSPLEAQFEPLVS